MDSRKLSDFIHMVDLKPLDIENFIASYILKGAKGTAIIETGPTCAVENLLAGLEASGVKTDEVSYVAASHIHIDHAGGAGSLLHHLPSAKLLVHPKGVPHLINPAKLWKQTRQVLGGIAEMYGEIAPIAKERIIAATDGMVLDLGNGVELRVLEVPGHASHELAFHENESSGIFPGDAAGVYLSKLDAIIPTTPPPFNLEMTLASIERLLSLKPRWLYYTHFGPTSKAAGKLETYKRQLKLWARIILDATRKNENLTTTYERILDEDPAASRAADFIKNHLILRRGVIMQNIQGFVEYFRAHPAEETNGQNCADEWSSTLHA
jgi:glyoxylase-like metal-dependent hydrolase (beta-lactamase superfamily II)